MFIKKGAQNILPVLSFCISNILHWFIVTNLFLTAKNIVQKNIKSITQGPLAYPFIRKSDTDWSCLAMNDELFSIANLWETASRTWSCAEPKFSTLCRMKLCSSDNHYTDFNSDNHYSDVTIFWGKASSHNDPRFCRGFIYLSRWMSDKIWYILVFVISIMLSTIIYNAISYQSFY